MLQTSTHSTQLNKTFVPKTSKLSTSTSKPASSICSTTQQDHQQQRLWELEGQIAELQNELKQIKYQLGTLDTLLSKQGKASQNRFQGSGEQYFLTSTEQINITSRQTFEEEYLAS